MASLLDMRRRIKSVKNTQQITKAMKMVAAAKLKRAQDRVIASRPYAGKMSDVLGDLSSKVAGEISHPLLDERGDNKYLIVLISADKGLAGAFNANVIKATQAFLKENSAKSAEMIPVGRKGQAAVTFGSNTCMHTSACFPLAMLIHACCTSASHLPALAGPL